jgi:hypothetical protein
LRRAIAKLTQSWLLIALTILAIASVWDIVVCVGLVPGVAFVDQAGPVVYDLSIGFLISYVFFLLVVVLPERLARRRTARLLEHQFRAFKLACIEIYLGVIGDSYDSHLPEKLLDAAEFRKYFSERYSSDQNRWHAVHNGLYEYGVPQVLLECELLSREIEFILIKLNIEDEEVSSFLKRLSRSLIRLRTSEPTYDDIKRLLNFLYPIHSHWSWLDGYVGRDPVGEMIAQL